MRNVGPDAQFNSTSSKAQKATNTLPPPRDLPTSRSTWTCIKAAPGMLNATALPRPSLLLKNKNHHLPRKFHS